MVSLFDQNEAVSLIAARSFVPALPGEAPGLYRVQNVFVCGAALAVVHAGVARDR